MDKCPGCGQQPITFKLWNRRLNAFRWQCVSCGIALKGRRLNLILGIATLFSGLASLFIASQVFGIELNRKSLSFYVLLITPMVIGSGVSYWLGGYEKRKL